MKILSLDLELNKDPVEIIQLGMCVGETDTGEILETVGCFIKISTPVHPYIETLTGITDADLATGGTIADALASMTALKNRHDCYCNSLQWGGGDTDALKNAVVASGAWTVGCWPFGHRYIDAKTVFQTWQLANGQKMQAGLAKSLGKVGLKFEGRKHNAIDDSVNTFRIYHKLLQLMAKKV